MGGESEERDVSLASGCQVAAALREAGHSVTAVDTLRGVVNPKEERTLSRAEVGLLPPERAPEGEGDPFFFLDLPEVAAADLIFPALHGGAGEGGTLQATMEARKLRYVGSDEAGCVAAMDKGVSKQLLRDAGIATPDWLVDPSDPEAVEAQLSLPAIVKPVAGGSSVRLFLARSVQEVSDAVGEIHRHGERALCERYLAGREVTVGILDAEPLPVGEILTPGELFDYRAKYQSGGAREIFPADLPGEVAVGIQEAALRAHAVLGLADLSRIDFMLDEALSPSCLEANALPGLTRNSLYPKAARAAGISFSEACDRIVKAAFRRTASSPPEAPHGE